jgi:hypothetical protein
MAIDMRHPGSLLCALLTLAVGAPVNTQSPAPSANATSAFDGTYVGVSAENNSAGMLSRGGGPTHKAMPRPRRFDDDTGYGQRIDDQHTVKGQFVGSCAYALTWRKQS